MNDAPRVIIKYPSGEVETLSARPTDKTDEFELRSHAFLMPLGPGDVVKVDDTMTVVDVVHLDPQFIYHVDLHLPVDYMAGPLPDSHPALVQVEKLVDEWSRDTGVTLLTSFSAVISSGTARWFADKVANHPFVMNTILTRTPDLRTVAVEAKPVL